MKTKKIVFGVMLLGGDVSFLVEILK